MEEQPMKSIATIIAVSIVTMVTAPAFAQTIKPATTQSECEKQAGMKWDDQTKTCVKK
jgi:hypothetical protein